MANDGVPVNSPVTGPTPVSQAPATVTSLSESGNHLPPAGQILPAKAAVQSTVPATLNALDASTGAKSDIDLRAAIARLNKQLNDSGKPLQFRIDTASGGKLIQQINPATGAVVGEYSTAQFPALAQGLEVSGLVIDSHA